jgi:hypothetical protein
VTYIETYINRDDVIKNHINHRVMSNIGGEGEVHRLTKGPIALLSNVFTSLPSSWFTVKG